MGRDEGERRQGQLGCRLQGEGDGLGEPVFSSGGGGEITRGLYRSMCSSGEQLRGRTDPVCRLLK